MQNNVPVVRGDDPVVRGDDLDDDPWFKQGGSQLRKLAGEPIRIPPADQKGNPVPFAATTETRAVSASRRGPGDTNTQSGGGAGTNTSTTVIQSDAGK